MSRARLMLETLVAIVLVGGMASTLYVRSRAASPSWEPSQVSVVCPGPPSDSLSGIPAITPRNDCTPSFTQQDARDYVSHVHTLFKITFVDQPTITHIWFITSNDAAKLANEAPSNLGSRVVCYVELNGTFTVDTAPGISSPAVPTPHHAFIIFDAQTGNLLGAGTQP